ncbi:DUF4244 domain-containing protein [Zhihengliuella salsuginis]|uniref:DUF4244 domain-containing protein n=1 Tax=Zhihengliuella salsuginis TaxID=578222 RepID=A0ABQ3GDV4_9MICC|nr:DUF4244 domain-containing protein [Zhihengliuella salsuginis]GHD02924.1 hypothetical protein GCM10008096_08600 [Zhihengliuella salsuginis]
MEQNRVLAESVSDVPDNVVELADHRPPEHTTEHGSERLRGQLAAEAGIATAEFAIVTFAAVAFAGLLVVILSSGDVSEMLMALVRKALQA